MRNLYVFDGRECPACELPLAREEATCPICGHGSAHQYSLVDGREEK